MHLTEAGAKQVERLVTRLLFGDQEHLLHYYNLYRKSETNIQSAATSCNLSRHVVKTAFEHADAQAAWIRKHCPVLRDILHELTEPQDESEEAAISYEDLQSQARPLKLARTR